MTLLSKGVDQSGVTSLIRIFFSAEYYAILGGFYSNFVEPNLDQSLQVISHRGGRDILSDQYFTIKKCSGVVVAKKKYKFADVLKSRQLSDITTNWQMRSRVNNLNFNFCFY